MMQNGGGRSLEDLRVMHSDMGLRELLGIQAAPSTDAVGDWLRRMGAGDGLCGLGRVNREVLRRALKRDDCDLYTLDIDATQVVAEKREAKVTYKGERGYMPMVGHLAENGMVVFDEFREGNDSPGSRNLEFIRQCAARMPAGKGIGFLRSDSAAYQAEVFNWCEENGIKFAIGGDLDDAVKSLIRAISASDWLPYQDGHIAEAVHCMNRTEKAFRLDRDTPAYAGWVIWRGGRTEAVHGDRIEPGGIYGRYGCVVQPSRRGEREPDQGVEDRVWDGADALWEFFSKRGVFPDRSFGI